MRIFYRPRRTWLIFVVLAPHIAASVLLSRDPTAVTEAKAISNEEVTLKPSNSPAKPASDGVGTSDAPVDGKDGRPHQGPFVETSAERDRKKAKENGEDVASKKIPAAELPSGAPTASMPETNDGVMDDPHRRGPKEGTRGTEGGISEKVKDGKTTGTESEKIPDPPKEQPPLPHSEQQSITDQSAGKDEGKKEKDKGTATGTETSTTTDEKKKQEGAKEPGGLEVQANPVYHF